MVSSLLQLSTIPSNFNILNNLEDLFSLFCSVQCVGQMLGKCKELNLVADIYTFCNLTYEQSNEGRGGGGFFPFIWKKGG